ncbi:MAG TPA: hypothetical protein VHT04_06060 [Stellaceae bacterium]|nr:hypothetical protein [Stellaceae bacterium]
MNSVAASSGSLVCRATAAPSASISAKAATPELVSTPCSAPTIEDDVGVFGDRRRRPVCDGDDGGAALAGKAQQIDRVLGIARQRNADDDIPGGEAEQSTDGLLGTALAGGVLREPAIGRQRIRREIRQRAAHPETYGENPFGGKDRRYRATGVLSRYMVQGRPQVTLALLERGAGDLADARIALQLDAQLLDRGESRAEGADQLGAKFRIAVDAEGACEAIGGGNRDARGARQLVDHHRRRMERMRKDEIGCLAVGRRERRISGGDTRHHRLVGRRSAAPRFRPPVHLVQHCVPISFRIGGDENIISWAGIAEPRGFLMTERMDT